MPVSYTHLDYDGLERIGSVRSCRTYYTYFAREFDAVYVHYGQSTFAKPYLKNVDNINGLDAVGDLAFYRTKDKKSPHNAYTSGGRITASIEKLGYTQSYASSYKGHYLFARDGREASLTERPGVMDAGTVKTGYIMNQAYFVYDLSLIHIFYRRTPGVFGSPGVEAAYLYSVCAGDDGRGI